MATYSRPSSRLGGSSLSPSSAISTVVDEA